MKRTPEQDSLLTKLKAANQRLMNERFTAHERHAAQADEEIREFVLERDKLAALLKRSGGSNAMIGEGLGTRRMSTKNPQTISEAIEHGFRFLDPASGAEEPTEGLQDNDSRYVWHADTDMLTVKFDPEDFEPFVKALAAMPTASVQFAFTYDRDADNLIIPSDDAAWTNPVVQVMAIEKGRTEALAFIHGLID